MLMENLVIFVFIVTGSKHRVELWMCVCLFVGSLCSSDSDMYGVARPWPAYFLLWWLVCFHSRVLQPEGGGFNYLNTFSLMNF